MYSTVYCTLIRFRMMLIYWFYLAKLHAAFWSGVGLFRLSPCLSLSLLFLSMQLKWMWLSVSVCGCWKINHWWAFNAKLIFRKESEKMVNFYTDAYVSKMTTIIMRNRLTTNCFVCEYMRHCLCAKWARKIIYLKWNCSMWNRIGVWFLIERK